MYKRQNLSLSFITIDLNDLGSVTNEGKTRIILIISHEGFPLPGDIDSACTGLSGVVWV